MSGAEVWKTDLRGRCLVIGQTVSPWSKKKALAIITAAPNTRIDDWANGGKYGCDETLAKVRKLVLVTKRRLRSTCTGVRLS